MSGNRPRAGALHFTSAAREAVAAGDPFDWLYRGEFRRRSDERDLLAALLHAENLEDEYTRYTAGGGGAARRLGLLPPTGDTPPDWQRPQAVRDLCDLGWHGDMGGCRTTAALRLALLGEATTTAVRQAAPRHDDAVFSADGC
jgi:hypothetical protein